MSRRPAGGVTLQDLDGQDWGDPSSDQSYLIRTCHRLRRVPLDQFDAEDLRIMIGQRLSLAVLVPLAVELLEADPLAGGDMVDGALLAAVLTSLDPAELDAALTQRLGGLVDRVAVADPDDVDPRLPDLIAAYRAC